MGNQVVIVAATRTPMGAFQGVFKNTSAIELGSVIIKKCVSSVDFDPKSIDQVIMGCVLSAGLGQSPARQASLKAGLSEAINCSNINKVCGSGMYSIMTARNAILAHDSDIVVAGGMENMTMSPYILPKARAGHRMGHGTVIDHMFYDGLENASDHLSMGQLAENAAKQYNIKREQQDRYTYDCYNKVFKAYENNAFANEIVPVVVTDKKSTVEINRDEPPFKVNLERIPTLKPAFSADGTITAASSSSVADGAAALMLMSYEKAKELGVKPIARIVAQSCYAQDPALFATAPIGAIKSVLSKSGWNINDVELFEINEAFAVVAMAAIKALDINEELVNIHGGACALGHPLGASGARVVVTLLNALKCRNKSRGLATLCVGGGEGVAMTVEMM